LFYALPAAAQLARDRAGHPAFSLALVLSRRPAADEDDIFSLIDSAAFACDVSIALPDSVTRADTLLPLFASQATFRLVAGGAAGSAGPGPALAEATAQGAGARAGLGATVDKAAAQAILGALQRRESNLTLACRVTYRTAETRVTLHLAARWTDVYDFLESHAGTDRRFTQDALRGHLVEMSRSGVIAAHRVEASGLETEACESDPSALWSAFSKVASMLFDTAESTYTLRDRPDSGQTIDIRLAAMTAQTAHVDLDAPLTAVIGGALDGLDAERFITLAAVAPGTRGGPQPVPRRVSAVATRDAEGETRAVVGRHVARAIFGAVVDYGAAGGFAIIEERLLPRFPREADRQLGRGIDMAEQNVGDGMA